MTSIPKVLRILVGVVLYLTLVPFTVVAVNYLTPEENLRGKDMTGEYFRVVGTSSQPTLEIASLSSVLQNRLDTQQYIRQLQDGNGFVYPSNTKYRYAITGIMSPEPEVTLTLPGEIFRYQLADGGIVPISRKYLNPWKIVLGVVFPAALIAGAMYLFVGRRRLATP